MSKAADVTKVALAEVGYREGKTNGRWNNQQKYSPAVPGLEWSQGQAWCATFVSWCAMKAGVAGLYPRTASCDVAGQWFKDRGRWSEYPAIGAQVFFGYPHDLNHTGIVYQYDDTYIYTVEGNTNGDGSREGDGVYLKKRLRRGSNVIGYGYPKFTEGIVSADPKYKKEAPIKPKATKSKTPNLTKAIKAAKAYEAALKKISRKNPKVAKIVDASLKETQKRRKALAKYEVK